MFLGGSLMACNFVVVVSGWRYCIVLTLMDEQWLCLYN